MCVCFWGQDHGPDYIMCMLTFLLQESKVRFDEDEEFKRRAYADVVKLQGGDPDVRKGWNLICDVSRKGIHSCVCVCVPVCTHAIVLCPS